MTQPMLFIMAFMYVSVFSIELRRWFPRLGYWKRNTLAGLLALVFCRMVIWLMG